MQIIRLPSPEEMVVLIKEGLASFGTIQWMGQVDSTNDRLMEDARLALGAYARPALLGAHHQTRGKGRAGRQWVNKEHTTLMFSCAFDVEIAPPSLPMLAPLLGVVVCEQLRCLVGEQQAHRLMMKWPNDILFDEAKLSGLLVEVVRPAGQRLSAYHHVVVVGMGLNLSHAEALSQSLQRPVADWTSVLGTLQEEIQRQRADQLATLVSLIAQSWYDAILNYQKVGFSPWVARYAAVDALKDQCVNVFNGDTLLFHGKACGLDQSASLQVQTEQGLKSVIYGDVSIRKAD